MKRQHYVDSRSLAPVVAKFYYKYQRIFGIHSHDVEDICGAAIVRLSQKLRKEGTNLQDFFERMSDRTLTVPELLMVCGCFQNEGRNYSRKSTYYKDRRQESLALREVGEVDVSQELLDAYTNVLDRIRLDFGRTSEEYAVALWLFYGEDEDRMFDWARQLPAEEWEAKVDDVLVMVRELMLAHRVMNSHKPRGRELS